MSPPAPRRNRIVPDPDEPSDLEDESTAPFGDDIEEEWEDEDGELASASGDEVDACSEEEFEAGEADDEEWEDEEAESDDGSDEEWDETEEDEWKEEELTQN